MWWKIWRTLTACFNIFILHIFLCFLLFLNSFGTSVKKRCLNQRWWCLFIYFDHHRALSIYLYVQCHKLMPTVMMRSLLFKSWFNKVSQVFNQLVKPEQMKNILKRVKKRLKWVENGVKRVKNGLEWVKMNLNVQNWNE